MSAAKAVASLTGGGEVQGSRIAVWVLGWLVVLAMQVAVAVAASAIVAWLGIG